jgi:hypothetical protein
LKNNIGKLFILWEFPQLFLGYLFYLFLRKKIIMTKKVHDFNVYFVKGFPGGISLSRFIFLNEKDINDTSSLKHEYGHSLQSVYLGWFYLIVIGVPSLTRSLIWKIFKLKDADYYKGYPEKWADDLGGNGSAEIFFLNPNHICKSLNKSRI